MGVLLTSALILAAASVFIELKLFYSSSLAKRLLRVGAFAGIIMSMMLSWVIGLLFGASGLIVMIAAMVSTAVTEPIHAINRKTRKGSSKFEEYKATYRPLGKFLLLILKLATLPIWLPVKIRRWYLGSTKTQSPPPRVVINVNTKQTGPDDTVWAS